MAQDNDPFALKRAAEIARQALSGEYDLLLACRDLASMQAQLSGVPSDLVNTFVGVASEVDELPIGAERRYWSAGALTKNDSEANRYRDQVKGVVTEALRGMLLVLGKEANTH
jgi:hypothetical protein